MLLIGNGTLITHDTSSPLLENGCIAIQNDTIIDIGPTTVLKAKYLGASFIDAKKGMIMPGLINTHNHIYSAFARGANLGGPTPHNFLDILESLWWKLRSITNG